MTSTNSTLVALAQQFQHLIDQFKAQMTDPDQARLLGIMQEVESFLLKNQPLIMEQCAMNGYSDQSPDWTQHYTGFFNAIISSIKYDQDPQHQPFNPELIFEDMTQLHYLMVTPYNQNPK